MMAAQILTSRGRSLGNKLPKLVASRLTPQTTSPCRFSTNPGLASDPASDGRSPPPKRHPQSFVQSDIDLDLGELETHLPPGYHQNRHRIQRGAPKPRPDGDGRDSYWRPPWKNPRAEIVSADDFANRPRVTFSESYASMHDAMAVLSWMSQADKDGMYNLYLQMMTAIAEQQEKKLGKMKQKAKDLMDDDWQVLSTNTSHEYVIRVVAQKYNVTTSRAGGVIQLQHNEEQLKKDPNFHVNHALQAHVDATVRENIKGIYRDYGEKDPLQFVEDPIASTGDMARVDLDSPVFLGASELTDVDALFKKTRKQEIQEARVRIASHVYVEDVDERTRKVKIDREATRLLKMGEKLGNFYEDFDKDEEVAEGEDGAEDTGEAEEETLAVEDGKGEEPAAKTADDATPGKKSKKKKKALRTKVPKNLRIPPTPAGAAPYPNNNRGYNETPESRRPRWKYAAQIINTHAMENPTDVQARGKMVSKRAKGKRHGRIVDGNTIIEEGGKLRVASVAELEQTSWKHVRNESEFMFKGVKEAWLKRQLEGEVGGWGLQEEVMKVDPKMLEDKEEEDGGDDAADGGDGGEGADEAEGATEGSSDKKE